MYGNCYEHHGLRAHERGATDSAMAGTEHLVPWSDDTGELVYRLMRGGRFYEVHRNATKEPGDKVVDDATNRGSDEPDHTVRDR